MKRFLFVMIAVLLALALAPAPAAHAANPAPVQIFYVTLPETDGLTVLSTINGTAVSPMYTYFSIAIGVNGTYVYYDQWENGYDSDIATPTNLYNAGNLGGTQIWGNGEADDGCAPNLSGTPVVCNDANDILNAGDVIVPFNSIDLPRDSNVIRFDAKDKVGASSSIAIARATWASGSGTLNAFAHEMYATAEWGLVYEAPVGTNTANAGAMFEYSGLSIMASQNDTTVQIDADANGSYETTIILQEGGGYLVSGTLQGAKVSADKPVQVVLVTGDIGSNYESRDMNLLPVSKYGSSYWSPVGKSTGGVANPVRLFLYNPSNTNSIYITCKAPAADNYRDEFGAVAYNNSNGSLDWSTNPWTEVNDNNSAVDGFIRVTGGQLQFGTNASTPANTHIYRVAPMSGYTAATLSYSYSESANAWNDAVQVQVRNLPGDWATLATINGNSNSGTGSHDISAYIDSDTEIRFNVSAALESNEFMYFDNVNIALSPGSGIATTTQPVGTSGTVTFDLADDQAAHCYASTSNGTPTSDPIFAVGTMDTDGQAWDWSFTVYPDSFLSTDALVGLGLGQDPTLAYTENGNPLWVTPACEAGTWVYVDWDNNGAADPVDTNGDGTAETGSENGIFVSYLQSVRLFDPAGGLYAQTGARVWSRTASDVPDRTDPNATAGCNLALAWGQDPEHATGGQPGLDVGTSIPPLRLIEGTKSLTFAPGGDTEPVGVLNPGDKVYYNITIKNAGAVEVKDVHVYDTVPDQMTYVANTTEKDLTSNAGTGPWVSITDDSGFPLDSTGGVLLGDLAAGDTFYVRFQVTLNDLTEGDYSEITNCNAALTGAGDFERCVTSPAATRDWGDLPDSYGTTAAADGPRHSRSDLTLGSLWDVEAGGQPLVGADGDDVATSPDEDGVSRNSPSANWSGGTGAFRVTVSGGSACLNAWMDYTNDAASGVGPTFADGNFTKTGGYDTYGAYSEHIIQNATVNAGSNDVSFSVPAGLLGSGSNSYYFRFRLSPLPCGTIAPTGFVSGGEVEDYRFTFSPLAVTLASFTVDATPDGVTLAWETVSEQDNAGFNVYRAEAEAGPWAQLNAALIPAAAPGSAQGHAYVWTDATARPGLTYWYILEDVALNGATTQHAPAAVTVVAPNALQVSGLVAAPGLAPAVPLAALAFALASGLALARRRRR